MIAGALSDLLLDGQLLEAIAVTAIPALIVSGFCAVRSVISARRRPAAA
jgi:hypothetical protein